MTSREPQVLQPQQRLLDRRGDVVVRNVAAGRIVLAQPAALRCGPLVQVRLGGTLEGVRAETTVQRVQLIVEQADQLVSRPAARVRTRRRPRTKNDRINGACGERSNDHGRVLLAQLIDLVVLHFVRLAPRCTLMLDGPADNSGSSSGKSSPRVQPDDGRERVRTAWRPLSERAPLQIRASQRSSAFVYVR